MALNVGPHAGFRVSTEDGGRYAYGDLKTPVGSNLRQFSLVAPDPANPGYLKASADGTEPLVGFVLQFDRGENLRLLDGGDAILPDSWSRMNCLPDHRSVLSRGRQVVWFANIAQRTRLGRTFPAVTMWDSAALTSVGDPVGWDGSKYGKAADAAHTLGRVVSIRGSLVEVEFRL